jgi:hypothetical protein
LREGGGGLGESVRRREYVLRVRLSDGRTVECEMSSPRPERYRTGDFINLPVRADGRSEAGKGFIWRIVADEEPNVLVLAYVRPNA